MALGETMLEDEEGCSLSLQSRALGAFQVQILPRSAQFHPGNACIVHVEHGHYYKKVNHLNDSLIWVHLHLSIVLQSLTL